VRVVLVGSAAELGPVPVAELPVGEDHPCRPRDPYGLSKWFATAAGLSAGPPVHVSVARVFNPVGPGMPATQAFGRFARVLVNAQGGPQRLRVGELEARRDFVDVRDVAGALVAIALRGADRTVYHVGRGISHSVGEGLQYLVRLSGLAVSIDRAEGLSHSGPADSRADISRIVTQTGWAPEYTLEQSLSALWGELRGLATRAEPARSVA
jgi:GDP-4-dehydro-6-deoxy-D-mannose reductase